MTTSALNLTAKSDRIAGLDGLRAIAIALVLIFHFHPELLPGGFVGVDVFFVISGYLITTLLLREHRRSGRIDLGGFWLRRMRRLFPAIAALLLVTLPVAALASRDLLLGVKGEVFGALTFTYNWVQILAGSSYFDRAVPDLYANLWSLAIEEQFYLLWPLLLLLMLGMKWRGQQDQRLAGALSSALAVLSAGCMAAVFSLTADPTRVHYGLDTHFFGLMLGAALAFFTANTPVPHGREKLCKQIAPFVLGLSFIAVLSGAYFFGPDAYLTYRGGLFLVSLSAAALIYSLLLLPQFAGKYVDNAAFRWLGNRSYGIYLWHWPLLLIAEQIWLVPDNSWKYWVLRAVTMALTLGAAELSYRYLETPIRVRGFSAWWNENKGLSPRHRQLGQVALVTVGLAASFALATAPQRSTAEAATNQTESRELVVVTDSGAARAALQQAQAQREAEAARAAAAQRAAAEAAKKAAADQRAKELNLPPFQKPGGAEITAVGDSLIYTSRGGLEKQYPGIEFLAKSNQQWRHALDMIKAGEKDGKLRRAVILDFGTNAGLKDPKQLTDVLDYLGPQRQIVLVNNYSRGRGYVDSANAAYAAAAAKRPNVELADWVSVASQNPQYLQADRIHPNLEGMHIFAQTIDAAFTKLSEKLTKAYDSAK